ncbi:hypothetical protein ACVWYH_002597 [Bradyrhizobium sp. GM24.11]
MKFIQRFLCTTLVRRRAFWPMAASVLAAIAVLGSIDPSTANEDGISFWLPGTFGSLAAVPTAPGFSFVSSYYHTSVTAGANVSAAREITIGQFTPSTTANLAANLRATGDLFFLTPAYTFAMLVVGGQAAVSMTGVFGRTSTSVNGTLTGMVGPFPFMRSISTSDELTSVGDLYPMANLKGYYEFAADNRPQGWNVWLTFAISPPTPGAPPPRAPLVYK